MLHGMKSSLRILLCTRCCLVLQQVNILYSTWTVMA